MILGIDTATAATAAAVLAPGVKREARDDPPPGARPNHASRLLALVEEVVAGEWDEVRRIAVGVGPGGFTGLRHGIATARALAQARGLPLVGVSSLEALAAGEPVYAVIDARRGEVFAYAAGRLEAQAIGPEDLAARLVPGAVAVGDGAVRFREQFERAGATVPPDDSPAHRVSALQVCRLGAAGEPTARDALLPDYLRDPDAKPR